MTLVVLRLGVHEIFQPWQCEMPEFLTVDAMAVVVLHSLEVGLVQEVVLNRKVLSLLTFVFLFFF